MLIHARSHDIWVTCHVCEWVACFGGSVNPIEGMNYCDVCGMPLSWKIFTRQQSDNMMYDYYTGTLKVMFHAVTMKSEVGAFLGAMDRPKLSALIHTIDENDLDFWME